MISLRSKIALSIFLGVGAVSGTDLLLQDRLFSNRFQDLDADEAEATIEQIATGVHDEIERLVQIAERWNSEDPDSPPSGWEQENVHLVHAHDSAGRVLFSRAIDPLSGEPLELREVPGEQLSQLHPFIHPLLNGHAPVGLLITERGALLVGSAIADRSGSPQHLVVGRFLDRELVNELQAGHRLELEVVLTQGHPLSPDHLSVVERAMDAPHTVTDLGDDVVQAWAMFSDLSERPAFLIGGQVPRAFGPIWEELRRHAQLTTLAVATLFPLLILLLLQWIVTGPLERLATHARRIGVSNDSEARIELERGDEIGQLAREFDSMLEKLADSRRQVVQNARLAGMSEVSSGVLHNAGNLLNSVTVSADLTQGKLQELPIDDLKLLLETLREHGDDLGSYFTEHPRGVHFPRYLDHLIEKVAVTSEYAQGEALSLKESVDRVVALIHTLENSDSRARILEPVDLPALIDAVTELCLNAATTGGPVSVQRDYASLPKVQLERHRLLEVLSVVIRHALHSLEVQAPERPTLTLRMLSTGEEGIRIEVSDNGAGMSPEELIQVFQPRYTSETDDGELDLHLAAVAAGEMQGTIAADSPGRGQGTTVILDLPLRAAQGEVGSEVLR